MRHQTQIFAAFILAALGSGSIVMAANAAGGSGVPASTQGAYVDYGSIPPDVQATLGGTFDVQIGEQQVGLPVSLAGSLKPVTDLARASFGLDPSFAPASVSLAIVTTPSYGQDAQTDPMAAPKISPAIDHALTWVVTFDQAPVPYFGRAGTTKDDTVDHATLVEFIDPVTSKFEYAISY